MKERPILFTDVMVRALINGTKTQTRRTVKRLTVEAHHPPHEPVIWLNEDECAPINSKESLSCCPYGQPSDRLWVREAWAETHILGMPSAVTVFRAFDTLSDYGGPWKPSIHMHRWRSRIILEITGVRVERLNDISRGDAMSEGCPYPNMANGADPRTWYINLWDKINGPGSWEANPWVWVVCFKMVNQ